MGVIVGVPLGTPSPVIPVDGRREEADQIS